jgi:hypothetical protein
MTNRIGRRLDRLETEVQKTVGDLDNWRPGGPVFRLIDNPRDPENPKRLQEAEQFRRDHPNGLIIHRVVVYRIAASPEGWASGPCSFSFDPVDERCGRRVF